jgi:hypothetical protein
MLDFHLLFTVLALLCGVGLEWINNVGVSKSAFSFLSVFGVRVRPSCSFIL